MRFKGIDLRYWNSFFLFSFSLAFLLLFVIKTPTNGDTYVYARSISTFEGPSIHFGYFIIGTIIHAFLQRLGSTPLQTLGYISVFFGSISVACMYLFTFELSENHYQSYLAAFLLLFSGAFWYFSEHGEVYVPQLSFILLSILFILRKKTFISSLLFLIAVSITPTSCLALPPMIYLMYLKQFEKRQLIYFFSPIFFSATFLLLWDFDEIIDIAKWAIVSPKIFFDSFSYRQLVERVAYNLMEVYGKSYNLFSLFALFGFAILFREDKRIWFLMLFFSLPFSLYFLNIGLLSGDHLMISFIVISFLGSYSLSRLFDRLTPPLRVKYGTTLILICGHLFFSYQLFIRPEIRDSQELENVVHTLEEQYDHNAIMISDYSFGMAFWYLTQRETDLFLLTGRPNVFLRQHYPNSEEALKKLETKFWINISHFPDFVSQKFDFKQIINGRPVYFVDRSYWPSWFVQFLLPENIIEKRRSEIPKVKRVKKYFEKEFGEKVHFHKIINSPFRSVYVIQGL
jgi:hypothetical protein